VPGAHDGKLPTTWNTASRFSLSRSSVRIPRLHRGSFTTLLYGLALSGWTAPTRRRCGYLSPLAGQRQPNKLNHTIPPRDVVLERTRSSQNCYPPSSGVLKLHAPPSRLKRLDFAVVPQQNGGSQNSSHIVTLVPGITRHNALRAGQPASPDPTRNRPMPQKPCSAQTSQALLFSQPRLPALLSSHCHRRRVLFEPSTS
jgi:hypothetical protein